MCLSRGCPSIIFKDHDSMMDSAEKSWQDLLSPEGVMIISPDYRITYFNRAAEDITGYDTWKVMSKDCRFLFSDLEEAASHLNSTLESGKSHSNLSVRIQSSSGEAISTVVSLTPILISDNRINGAVLVFHTPEKVFLLFQSLRDKTLELLNERNKLDAIFNSRLEGTFTIDKECTITMFNRAADKITGYKKGEAMGKKCWEIFQSRHCEQDCAIGKTKTVSLQRAPASLKELYITRKDGKKVPIRGTAAPLYNAEGDHIGAVETFQDITELKNLSNHLDDKFSLHNIIGHSQCMERIYGLIENVSKNNSTILITGESGTGKELVARAIHLNSYRRSGPFAALNCSAFAETLLESELFGHEKGAFTGAIQMKQGRFEIASGGTLFLDEIGDLSPSVQVKLLRVLETRTFERVGGTKPISMDVRLIAATHKDLAGEVEAGNFREDFYYRINVINIHLPPLRERMDDLPLLVHSLMEKNSTKYNKNINSISPNALKVLKSYHWPGNVRELENVIEHAFVMCHGELIDTEHLPDRFISALERVGISVESISSIPPLQHAEKAIINQALIKNNGHRGKTAEALGIDKSTLWRKMKKHKLLP